MRPFFCHREEILMEKLRNFRRAIGYVLLFLVIQFVCTLLIDGAAQAYFQFAEPDRAALLYEEFVETYGTVILMSSQVLTLLILIAIAKLRGMSLWDMVQGGQAVRKNQALFLLLAGVCGNILTTGVMDLLPLPEQLMESYNQASQGLNTSLLWADLLSVAFFAPLVEELIFRGLVLSRLRAALPGWLAVLLQGLVFGFVHGQLVWIIYASLFGFLLGYVRLRTGSLAASILLHLGFNLSSFFIGIVFYLAPQNFLGQLLVTLLGGGAMVVFLLKAFQEPRRREWEEWEE